MCKSAHIHWTLCSYTDLDIYDSSRFLSKCFSANTEIMPNKKQSENSKVLFSSTHSYVTEGCYVPSA